MRKIFLFLILCSLFFNHSVNANEFASHAKSAYLMEASTGKVLFEKNAEEKMFPASMTKMMSLILVYEALNSNQIKEEEILTISENAASMGGSQIFLQPSEQMSISDLLKSICIASANDAMVAMAEHISGSVSEFVKEMNEKAKEYHLVNTNFENTTGLHDENHYSCAKDMAIIAQKLIEIGGNHLLEITSTYDAYIRENTENPFWLVNTNKLVKHVDSIDGLKTGFTQEALSCITVTAIKDNVRMIGVVMKEPDSKTRNKEIVELIQFGLSQMKYQPLLKKDDIFMEYAFDNGKPNLANLVYLDDVGYVVMKDEEVMIESMNLVNESFELPLNEKDKIGRVEILLSNNQKISVDVGVNSKIEKMDFIDYFVKSWWRVLA